MKDNVGVNISNNSMSLIIFDILVFCRTKSSLKKTPLLLPLSLCNVSGYIFYVILPSFWIFGKEKPEIMLTKGAAKSYFTHYSSVVFVLFNTLY